MHDDLPDIQHQMKPEIEIPIKKVGVQNVKLPILLESMSGGVHELLSTVTMTTDLRKDIKGISMSMLYRTLTKYLDVPLKNQILFKILKEFRTEVETDSVDSSLKFEFQLPVTKISPISNIKAVQYYDCSFESVLTGDELRNYRFFEKVIVPYSSYCPCSASLCEDLKSKEKLGFPHAQRCYATVFVEILPPNIVWLEEIIKLVEDSVKTITYPVLRRVDEQEISKIAYENPLFVEDAIRRISRSLDFNGKIYDWIVKCVHQESIHPSDAIAINWKGIENGFNGLNTFS